MRLPSSLLGAHARSPASNLNPITPDPDDFVKNPISALRFIPLSLRRTTRTPRSTEFARLDLGLFTKASKQMTFCESIIE
jgi:hypothetical protein